MFHVFTIWDVNGFPILETENLPKIEVEMCIGISLQIY